MANCFERFFCKATTSVKFSITFFCFVHIQIGANLHISYACPIIYVMKLFDCLPIEITSYLNGVDDVRELRVRDGCPVRVNIAGLWYFLGSNGGFVSDAHLAVTVDRVCDGIVKAACAGSVYAYEKSLANGYFTLEDGVRVGVCGQISGSEARVFRSYSSLCFRIPHCISCVTKEEQSNCEGRNTIVLGAPGAGKTTYLRDVALKLGQKYNLLVVDERGELFYDDDLTASSCCDVLKWSDKAYAFEIGIRSMAPQYLVCDELTEKDVGFVRSCVTSGIKLICSAHAQDKEDFDRRFGLLDTFEHVVNLNKKARGWR